MSDAEFNVNNNVWVKVTETGRLIHDEHWRSLGLDPPPLRKDADGWSQFQLWDLMALFGASIYCGCHVPFETTIRIRKPETAT